MARKSNAKKGGGTGGRRRAEPAAEVAVVEEVEGSGIGIDEGIVLGTFLLLAGAVTLVWMALGTYPA